MDWQTLGAFLIATSVLLATPGPCMATVVGNTITGGQATGFRTVLGVGLGEITLLGLLSVSYLLSSRLFGEFFPWVSLVSAAYLAWLAVRTFIFTAGPSPGGVRRPSSRPFLDGLAVTVSNPTSLLFYSAFFIPFIQEGQSLAAQLAILVVLYMTVSFSFDLACVIFVTHFAQRRGPCAQFTQIARLCSAGVYLSTSVLAVSSFFHTVTL